MSDGGTNPSGGAAAPAATSTPAAPAQSAAPVPQAPANTNAAPAEPKHRVKIGGEEREYSVSELAALAEKGRGAEQKFRESAELKKRMTQDPVGLFVELAGDPRRAAQDTVKRMLRDPQMRKAIEETLVETYDYEGMPADERKRLDDDRETKRKAAEYDAHQRQEAERASAQRVAQLEAQYTDHFGQKFSEALTAGGVPVDEDSITMMSMYVQRAIERNEQVTVDEIVAKIKTRLGSRGPDIKAMTAEQLYEMLSEEQRTGFREVDLKKLRGESKPIERTTPQRGADGRFAPANGNGEPKRKEPTSLFFQRIRGER